MNKSDTIANTIGPLAVTTKATIVAIAQDAKTSAFRIMSFLN